MTLEPTRTATPRMAQGKRLLMDAALRMARRASAAAAISLRELAREAGLNHNTFYRHFSSQEALLEEIVRDFGMQLREGLKQARMGAPTLEDITPTVVGWTLDFALAHQDIFLLAMRERYGPPGPIREAVENMLRQLQDDMLSELQVRQALPPLPDSVLRPVLAILIDHTFKLCCEHIEKPQARAERLAMAKMLFDTLMLGTIARQMAPQQSRSQSAPQ